MNHYVLADIPPASLQKESSNQRELLNNIAKKLNISSPDDWYHAEFSSIMKHGGGQLLARNNDSLYQLLTTVYPEYQNTSYLISVTIARYKWDDARFRPPPAHFGDTLTVVNRIARTLSIFRKNKLYVDQQWIM